MTLEEALYCGRALFSFMEPFDGQLIFAMRESRPTKRTAAALDLLVEERLVSVKVYPDGSQVFTPLVKFRRNYAREDEKYKGWIISEKVK